MIFKFIIKNIILKFLYQKKTIDKKYRQFENITKNKD